MTDPIDIHALKAAALDPTKHRTHDDRVMMVARVDVLALIERLERAEQRYVDFELEVNAGRSAQHERLVARLEKLASLLREWRAAKFFDTRERWLSWVEEFGPRVDAALAALGAP